MSIQFFITQLLNGVQFGLLLFLMAAGLTLVLGIMSFVNLAHGSLYMAGAYIAAVTYTRSESFMLAIAAGVAGLFVLAIALDRIALAPLHRRSHLDQVLATFGIVLFANEAATVIFGSAPVFMDTPAPLSGAIEIMGFNYPAYRGAIIIVGLLVALGLHILIDRTRVGMLIRAGASNRNMVDALGVNIKSLTTLIFALGAALAGLAGAMVGPVLSIQPGMGEPVLILTLVVIVIGGIGSVRGCFVAALLVGLVDTAGRAFITPALRSLAGPATAADVGPALASVLMYLLMAAVLSIKPSGLFPARG